MNKLIERISKKWWNEVGYELYNNPLSERSVAGLYSVLLEEFDEKRAKELVLAILEGGGPIPPKKEEDPNEKELDQYDMLTQIEKDELKKKEKDLDEDTWVKNKKSGSVYKVKKFNANTQDPATPDDVENAKQKRDTSKQKLEKGEFDPQENKESMDSFIEVGFGDSDGAPGSPGSMLNEIVSITSATDSFNSGKPFDYDSQLESNVNKLKGSGLADENDGTSPPAGAAQSNNNHIT